MTHTVHPFSHRLGIIRDWRSRWFGAGARYRELLRIDTLLREYLMKRLHNFYIAGVEIERSGKQTRIAVRTARPGMVIGRQGEGATRLKNDIIAFLKKNGAEDRDMENVRIDIEEVRSPEAEAAVVARMIAEGLEKRLPFRRVLKQTVDKVMANRQVQGVRVILSGRLGGAEMGRKEQLKRGMLPLQTFRADVDFARARAHLPYGTIGIKVWLYRGEKFDQK